MDQGEDRTKPRASTFPRDEEPHADSVRGVASEEFLFHLYRGAEMLQDSRVHEAKEELEAALALQPRDFKGQDLLAGVYFRLGLYPRAISIYEELRRHHPGEAALLVNLALCYLKTGQGQQARSVLEELVREQPDHVRAWGYLGLAYERLGDLDKAEAAFDRAGHTSMAKRVAEQRAKRGSAHVVDPTAEEDAIRKEDLDVGATAAVAFSELDSGELSFALAEPALRRTESGTWRAVELGAAARTSPSVPPPPPAAAPPKASFLPVPPSAPSPEPPLASLAPDAARGALRSPRAFESTMRDATLTCPEGEPVAMHASGLVLVQTTPEFEFAARLDALRSYTGELATQVLQRQTRTASQEPFGGVAAPLMRLRAGGPLVLGPRASHRLVPLRLDGELAFLREDAVLGFDLRLTFENGRLTFAESEQLYVVQFRGAGTVVLELLDPIVALPVTPQRAVTARRESIIGWQGRLLPRALPMSEAPSGQRGLVTFAGDGALLLSGH